MKKISLLLMAGLTFSGAYSTSVIADTAQAGTEQTAEKAEQSAEGQAEENQVDASPRVRRTQTLREVVYSQLEEARSQADEGEFEAALLTLERLERRKRNSYERAMTHNMYAYVYSTKEDYEAAIPAYEAVLEIDNAPDSLKQTTRFTLAKLHMMQEDFESSLAVLNEWMESSDNVGADAFMLRSQIQYQRQQYDLAGSDIATAIQMRKDADKKVAENWLLLQRAVLFQQKDYKGLAVNLEALIANYSKGEYWMQLAAVYNELDRADEELATLETAYDQKLMSKESEYLNFAQALLSREIPFKAAAVLEQAMQDGSVEKSARNLSLLGDAWMMAKEYDKAIVSMTAAADESGKGTDYFKLAQIYTERQEWNKSLQFTDKALATDDLKAPYQALIIKGLAQYNLDRLEDASLTFFKAAGYPQAEKVAHQWQEYIESEQQRREYIASAGI